MSKRLSMMVKPSAGTAAKHRDKVLDESMSSMKRLKALQNFIDVEENPMEILEFYKTGDNDGQIWRLIQDGFQPFLNEDSRGKRDPKDLPFLLGHIRNLAMYRKDKVGKKWQARAIASTIYGATYGDNKAFIRVEGFDTLLHYIDTLDKNVTNTMWRQFKDCLCLPQLVEANGDPSIKLPDLTVPKPQNVFTHSKDPITEEDSLVMIKTFLSHLTHAPELFRSWIEHLKHQFWPVFYPEVCKRIGTMEQDDETGFVNGCPFVVSDMMVDSMEDWLGNNKVHDILTTHQDNFDCCVEIFRQGLHLPLYFSMTIQKSINYFNDWLLDGRMPEVIEGDIQKYVRDFVDYTSYMFTRMDECENSDELTTLVALCRSVLMFYRSLAKEKFFKMDQVTWKKLMLVTVDITNSLLADSSPDTAEQTFAKLIASDAVEVLMVVWIRSQMVDEEMWLLLHNKIVLWCHWPIVVDRWKSILIQVSQEVQNYIGTLVETTTAKRNKTKDSQSAMRKKDFNIVDFDGVPKVPGQVAPSYPIDIMGLQWNEDNGNFIWLRIVYLLGNINSLKNPEIHAVAVSGYVDTADWMLTLSYKLNRGVFYEPPAILNLFGPTFVEIADRQDVDFDKSRALALQGLSGLIHRVPRDHVTTEYLSHFYRTVFNAILSRDFSFITEVINNNTDLFVNDLPGATVLIPSFINIIDQLIDPSINIYKPGAELRRSCIHILNSILCLPERYPGCSLPDLNTLKSSGETKSVISYDELYKKAIGTLNKSLDAEDNTINKQMVLWSFSQVLNLEFARPAEHQNTGIAKATLARILLELNNKEVVVANTAMDGINSLLAIADLVPEDVSITVISAYANQILQQFESKGNPAVTAYLYYSMLEWIVSVDFKLIEGSMLSKPIFDCIQRGLADTTTVSASALALSGGVTSNKSGGFLNFAKVKQEDESSSSKHVDVSPIADAAEAMLAHMVNALNHFPTQFGSTRIGADISEEDDRTELVSNGLGEAQSAVKVFVNNNNQLLSFVEIPTEEGVRARIISRDMTGKYVWDGIVSWDKFEAEDLDETVDDYAARVEAGKEHYRKAELLRPELMLSGEENKQKLLDLAAEIEEMARQLEGEEEEEEDEAEAGEGTGSGDEEGGNDSDDGADDDGEPVFICEPVEEVAQEPSVTLDEFQREPGQPPEYDEELVGLDGASMLHQLLEYISERYPDTLPYENWPSNVLPEFCAAESVEIDHLESIFQQQASFEGSHLQQYIREAKLTVLKEPYHAHESYAAFQHSRMLLAQFGFLNIKNFNTFRALELDDKMFRALKELDKTPVRETFKVGVLYVGEGQRDQYDFLTNESGSEQYEEFLHGLGWDVDLATHDGYMGGLDRNLTTGVTAPYYANSLMEVMFHVPSRMPNNPMDDQQSHKRRHLVNDVVHIVWCEGGVGYTYDPTFVPSPFTLVHIVIYPLSNDMFRIGVYFKSDKPLFGPLINGATVPRFLLAPLVRATALNAAKYVRLSTEGHRRAYPARREVLQEIIGRFTSTQSYSDFLASLFDGSTAQ